MLLHARSNPHKVPRADQFRCVCTVGAQPQRRRTGTRAPGKARLSRAKSQPLAKYVTWLDDQSASDETDEGSQVRVLDMHASMPAWCGQGQNAVLLCLIVTPPCCVLL